MPGLADILGMLGSGGGAPPGGMGGGMPAPGGMPSTPPGSPGLEGLSRFQSEMAPGKGEEEALMNASVQLGIALKGIYLRSPKAAKLLLGAMRDIQSAREELQKAGTAPMQAAPNLGVGDGGAGMAALGL